MDKVLNIEPPSPFSFKLANLVLCLLLSTRSAEACAHQEMPKGDWLLNARKVGKRGIGIAENTMDIEWHRLRGGWQGTEPAGMV